MKKTPVLLVLLLAACTKNHDVNFTKPVVSKAKPETCSFGITNFNLSRRAMVQDISAKGKPGSSTGSVTTPNAVILLDFDGQLVTGTSWNVNGDISCAPANLTMDQIDRIINRVTEDYRPFNVVVTTDETVYNTANPYKRQRVVVTETWEWYGQSGGTSYIGSFTWGDNTPCFVFSSLLSYNEKNIGEACSHEVGHTLGLRHQSLYADCVYASEYNSGAGSGVTSWAPIMGNAYYRNITTWYNGPNPYGCTSLQDDVAIIVNTLGYKTDDYPNAYGNTAPTLTASMDGIINNNSDVDFFYVNPSSAVTVSVVPYNLGNEDGANMDMLLRVYDNHGKLLQTVNDPYTLKATATLSAGKYYISVAASANPYAPQYGMMGKYTVNVQ